MNTTTATASSINNVSTAEKTVRFQVTNSTGDLDIVLTVTEAAERAFDLIANAGRWLYTGKNDGTQPIMQNVDTGNKVNGVTTLIGLFNNADNVLLLEAFVGGYEDEDADVVEEEEVIEDAYDADNIIGDVKLSYVDDVDGESTVLDKVTHQPQLVVSIVTDENGKDNTHVIVRNTDKAKDKLINNAAFILAALSKIQRDDV